MVSHLPKLVRSSECSKWAMVPFLIVSKSWKIKPFFRFSNCGFFELFWLCFHSFHPSAFQCWLCSNLFFRLFDTFWVFQLSSFCFSFSSFFLWFLNFSDFSVFLAFRVFGVFRDIFGLFALYGFLALFGFSDFASPEPILWVVYRPVRPFICMIIRVKRSYIYIYKCMYVCIFIFIFIYIYIHTFGFFTCSDFSTFRTLLERLLGFRTFWLLWTGWLCSS